MKTKQDQPRHFLSDAVKDNIDSVAAFYAREEAKITGTQSAIEKISCHFGSAVYFGGFILFVIFWIVANLSAARFGWSQFDPPPFIWLQGIVGLNGVLIAIAVLIRQNRMAQVEELRAHLNLQVNLLSEQKTTKVIQLLEELRQDSPGVRNRHDPEVDTMQMQTNPHAMLNAIEAQKVDKQES
ncbi:MAG: hypothetical protein JWQ21_1039 [Herminiimonas sp.]|nr:hypothetical protein [Herminiimonas sp.]